MEKKIWVQISRQLLHFIIPTVYFSRERVEITECACQIIDGCGVATLAMAAFFFSLFLLLFAFWGCWPQHAASTMKREEHSLFSSLMMTTSSLLLVHLYNYRYIYSSSTTAHNPFIGGDAWHIIVGAPLPSRKNEGLCWGSSDVDRILLRSCLHLRAFLRLGTKKVHQSSVFLSSKFSFSYYFGTSTLHNIPSLLSELI